MSDLTGQAIHATTSRAQSTGVKKGPGNSQFLFRNHPTILSVHPTGEEITLVREEITLSQGGTGVPPVWVPGGILHK